MQTYTMENYSAIKKNEMLFSEFALDYSFSLQKFTEPLPYYKMLHCSL